MKKIYISAPFRDKTLKGAKNNVKLAEFYGSLVRDAGHKTVIVHTLIAERWGIKLANKSKNDKVDIEITKFNLRELAKCDILAVCGGRITVGMAGEIKFAIEHHIPIIVQSGNIRKLK